MASKGDVEIDIEGNFVEDDLGFQDTKNADLLSGTMEDMEEDVTSDTAELLSDKKKSQPMFWSIEYYQQFFDVDTSQVLSRLLGSVIPNPRRNFLQAYIRPTPDLYGPFWICVTLVFTAAITGNVSQYFASKGQTDWVYDFHKVTLAATVAFSYWWLVPSILFAVLWWRGARSSLSYLELLCLYGYSLTIYVPLSILWMIPVTWLQWLLLAVGGLMSGAVLVITLWPVFQQDNSKTAVIISSIVFVLHILLAVVFMIYFFHHPVTTTTVQNQTTTTAKPVEIPEAAKLPDKGKLPAEVKGLDSPAANSTKVNKDKLTQIKPDNKSPKPTEVVAPKVAVEGVLKVAAVNKTLDNAPSEAGDQTIDHKLPVANEKKGA